MRVGSFDDSTKDLSLPAWARAGVAPAITVCRWGAVGFAIAFSTPKAFDGSYQTVVAVAIALFLTTWRTVLPVRLASADPRHKTSALVDVALFGVATGISGGLESPFTFALFVSIGVVAFGWGYMPGMWALLTAIFSMLAAVHFSDSDYAQQADSQRDIALAFMSLAVVLMCAFVRDRLVEAERSRGSLAGEIDSLSAANELLTLVNTVARSLPSSLTLREALEACRKQISDSFGAQVIALVAYDESAEEWVPRLADGCVLNPAYRTSQLPPMFKETLSLPRPMLIGHDEDENDPLQPIQPGMRSGLYARLETRSRVVGLLALEHPRPNRFNEHHLALMSDMAEVLALTIDNARWFGRLRTLGAEEERVRLARDLHDRLGQWLTYIGFELERIIALDSPQGRAALGKAAVAALPEGEAPEGEAAKAAATGEQQTAVELQRLYGDVQSALDELRETLRQLRSGVTEDDPFTLMADRLLKGFESRSGTRATLIIHDGGDRLPVPIENELFRILQEALNNISKHAEAQHVKVTWTVQGGNYELLIEDDGKGFAIGRGVRESAYGLVGMRERADVIGADLDIESRPGEGTRIRVGAGRIERGN